MALFKILRGGYQNKPETLTDGWAYFTPDNRGFYIDVVDNNVGGFSYNDRIQINEKVVKTTATLTASNWTSNTYSLSIDSRFSSQYYTLQIEPSLTGSVDANFAISSAMTKANISYMIDDTNSRIFFVANGTQPTINLPIVIKFIPKEINYIDFFIKNEGYVAIEGMTFEQWVNTPFNTENWSISGNSIHRYNSNGWYDTIDCSRTDLIAPISYAMLSEDDGCCFVAGTQVLMADNTTISIENVKIGDQVISYDVDTGENYIVSVLNTIVNKHSIKMAKVVFDNGIVLEMTDYHPIYTLNGWKSLTNHMGYETLVVGDIAKTINGWSGVVEIEQYTLETPIETYTLDVIGLKENPDRDDNTHDNFYANGIVAHNTACPH